MTEGNPCGIPAYGFDYSKRPSSRTWSTLWNGVMMIKIMVNPVLYWRSIIKDRLFLFLFGLSVLTFVITLVERRPSIERSAIPFNLTLIFFVINMLFAVITLRRESLLSYMFLTAIILLNGTLFFFFRYLLLMQAS
jgi:hypothetical protein